MDNRWAFGYFHDNPLLVGEAGVPSLRLAPMLIPTDMDQLVHRRRRLFSKLEFSRKHQRLWRFESQTFIPPTSSRAASLIDAVFEIQELEKPLHVIVANVDRRTYTHTVEKFEIGAYPLAHRLFLGIGKQLPLLEEEFAKHELHFFVTQYRSLLAQKRRKVLEHGLMTTAELFTETREAGKVIENVRLKVCTPVGDEVCRLRLDTQCRLLLEKWVLPWSPTNLIERLYQEYLRSKESAVIDLHSRSVRERRAILLRAPIGMERRFIELFLVYVRETRGKIHYILNQQQGYPVRLIDFISGASVTIDVAEDAIVILSSEAVIPVGFLELVHSIAERTNSQLVGGERRGE